MTTLTISDVPFEDAQDVGSITLRLHPLDVGWSLKAELVPVSIHMAEHLRASYEDARGDRRVIAGPFADVVRRLRALGYVIRIEEP